MNKRNNILICPLEWGLGHAGRMIPLALALQKMNNNIFVASGKELQEFFRTELSGVTYVDFPGFRLRYSRFLPQYASVLLRIPVLISRIITEHTKLKSIIKKNEIDIVISDNRFGLWNKKVKTVYVTHQLLIPFPLKMRSLEWIGVLFHRYIIRKYTFCFIPDLPGKLNISGRLSHVADLPVNARYIGILSRFTYIDQTGNNEMKTPPHNTLILSGPEPQRGILRKKILGIMDKSELPLVIFEGKPGYNDGPTKSGNIFSYNHLSSPGMKKTLLESTNIISRSGYTTIMELISLNRSALLVPTPGQTEQEYLAGYMSVKGWFTTVPQIDLNPGLTISMNCDIPGKKITDESKVLLGKALEELLNQ